MLRVFFRAFCVFFTILSFLLVAPFRELGMVLLGWSEKRKRHARTRAISLWSRSLLWTLNFKVEAKPLPHLGKFGQSGTLLVANHLSFWDALALASQTQAVFVTSVEVRDTPLLGWICRAGGCIFVERRSRDRSGEERAEVAKALREGATVALFPEATSTNGSGVLPFKRSFFTSALAAGSPVIPICINYKEVDDEAISVKNRDLLFYYGNHDFFTQLSHAFHLRSAKIEVDVLEAIETQNTSMDREELTQRAYEAIVSRYQPISQL
jgi:1-acyl-sn-glycerol-3-phosphate acyltransferase